MTAEDVLQELLKMHDECKGSHNYYLHAVVRIKKKMQAHQVINDPSEIRRVFELDDAEYPPPDSGFMKL